MFFAYTPFQVVAALAVREQYYPGCETDIILSDSIRNRSEMRINIDAHRLFHHVYEGNIRKFFPKNADYIRHNWNRLKSAFCPFYIAQDIGLQEAYDVFVTTEINYYTQSVFDQLRRVNPDVRVELMDEGYSSYTFYFREALTPQIPKNRMKHFLFHFPGRFYGRKFIEECAETIYFFAPELLCWKEIPYEIRPLNVRGNHAFLEKMNALFHYEKLKAEGIEREFEKPYLYFEESFFWSVGNGNDEAIIDHIADIIGKDNLLIKLHPRNRINRFREKGYSTNQTYGIPWELIAVNLPDDDRRVFLSFSSGAVLNYKFLSDKRFRTVLLFRCVGDRYYHVEKSVAEWFDKFVEHYGESVYIPSTLAELDDYLKKLRKDSGNAQGQ